MMLLRSLEGVFLVNETSEKELIIKYKQILGKLQEEVILFLPLIDQNGKFGKFLLEKIEKKFRKRNSLGNILSFAAISTNLQRIFELENYTMPPVQEMLFIQRIFAAVLISLESLGIANYEEVMNNNPPENKLKLATNTTEFWADRANARVSKIVNTIS